MVLITASVSAKLAGMVHEALQLLMIFSAAYWARCVALSCVDSVYDPDAQARYRKAGNAVFWCVLSALLTLT